MLHNLPASPNAETDLEKLLDYIWRVKYQLTASEKMIIQKQRNELKYNLLEGFIAALIEQGIPADLIHRTSDGYIFELQNYELGMIPVEIDIKIKNMDFIDELDGAIQEWEEKVEASRIREAKAKAKADEKARIEAEIAAKMG